MGVVRHQHNNHIDTRIKDRPNDHPFCREKPPPTKEQKINVSTILDYLSTRNRLADITHLYIKSNNFESKEILTPKNISVGLGVSYIEYSERAHSNSSYSLNFKATVGDLPLQSYTHIIPNITLSKYRKLSQSFDIKGVGAFTVKYSPETHLLEINQRSISSSLYQSNLLDLINKLFAGSTESLHNSPALTTQSKNGIPVQIIFTGLTALSNSDKSLINKIDDVSFIILIKRSSKKIVF